MAGTIKLEIVTPEKIAVREDVQIVAAPGVLGEFGVLIGHTPFMTTLKTGTIRFTDANGNSDTAFVSGGFAEALPNQVTILAESAERRGDIDVERAKAAMERARQRLSQERSREDIDFSRARAALERALERLRAAGARVD